mmetsp:Transcript_64410/g.172387  ORF Transcript_64410/g.172387 Transcript_64410/m.172387 type:complete len:279 (-) Transcript_64410:819-1655(-)
MKKSTSATALPRSLSGPLFLFFPATVFSSPASDSPVPDDCPPRQHRTKERSSRASQSNVARRNDDSLLDLKSPTSSTSESGETRRRNVSKSRAWKLRFLSPRYDPAAKARACLRSFSALIISLVLFCFFWADFSSSVDFSPRWISSFLFSTLSSTISVSCPSFSSCGSSISCSSALPSSDFSPSEPVCPFFCASPSSTSILPTSSSMFSSPSLFSCRASSSSSNFFKLGLSALATFWGFVSGLGNMLAVPLLNEYAMAKFPINSSANKREQTVCSIRQ